MSDQLALDHRPPPTMPLDQATDAVRSVMREGRHVGPSRNRTIEQDFRAYHEANPQVFERLVAYARQWRHRHPTRRVGIKALVERVRWDFEITASPDAQGFRINNSYTALYAREIMARYPDLADPPVFETRALRTDEEG